MEKKVTIQISNPNPYKSKKTGTEMVAYTVTGQGAEQYKAEQLAIGVDSSDDSGNPLMHFTFDASIKYGVEAELVNAVTSEGESIWFIDNDEAKQLEKVLNGTGTNATVRSILAEKETQRVLNYLSVLSSNRAKNIAKLQAKGTESFATVKKSKQQEDK